MKMMPQQYCLRWKHHHSNVQSMFAQLLEKERFCDVTLYCSPSFASQVPDKDTVDPAKIRGVSLRAHRVVLAACSELLGTLLGAHESQGEPVLVIDGAEPRHLRALLDYMYTGEMNVHHSQLASLLKTAEELRIKGLTDIRWNNKDEPPDCRTGAVTTTSLQKPPTEIKTPERRRLPTETLDPLILDHKDEVKSEASDQEIRPIEKINNVNDDCLSKGGPPPLIKLPVKGDKISPIKRDHSDTESPSPKRRRMQSVNEHSDDDDQDHEWQHGNMNITAERVVGWCAGTEAEGDPSASWERDASDDEWADAPTDIGSFLHTRLKVDGDNSADDDSNDGAPPSTSSSAGTSAIDLKIEPMHPKNSPGSCKATCSKSSPSDPRFADVVKLNDYLKHGRRPQFWEEHYVKRVMEAVRIKELEMKQAAEILGVSYGTLYGRYRDVFGCINRPYRTARDFWQAKGPAEVLERLQRGEISLDAGAIALGVSPNNLAAYMADLAVVPQQSDKEFEPIPIEIDPSLKKLTQSFTSSSSSTLTKLMKKALAEKTAKKVTVSSLNDEDPIPASVITTHDIKKQSPATSVTTTPPTGKWPAIRVASIDSLRGTEPSNPPPSGASPSSSPSPATTSAPTSPTHLMRTRPDLTIVAAKKPEPKKGEDST